MANRMPGGAKAKYGHKGSKMASDPRWPPILFQCVVIVFVGAYMHAIPLFIHFLVLQIECCKVKLHKRVANDSKLHFIQNGRLKCYYSKRQPIEKVPNYEMLSTASCRLET